MFRYRSNLNLALVVERDLRAQSWWWQSPVVAEGVASSVLWHENEELVVLEWQTELLGDVVVVRARLVASTAGAVEGRSGIDARGGDVTEVLSRDRVTGTADWRRVAVGKALREGGSQKGGAGQQEGGSGAKVELHLDRLIFLN